jgi:dTDP-4-dehydrorhamnose 3,5-epimerase
MKTITSFTCPLGLHTALLCESADVFYKVNGEYSLEHDRGVLWNDPAIGIPWNITQPLLSNKDQSQLLLANADNNFVYKEMV